MGRELGERERSNVKGEGARKGKMGGDKGGGDRDEGKGRKGGRI